MYMTTTQHMRKIAEAFRPELAEIVVTIEKVARFDHFYNREVVRWEISLPAHLSGDAVLERSTRGAFRSRKDALASWEAECDDLAAALGQTTTGCWPDSAWLNEVLDRHDADGSILRAWF